jgi:hypothetical protein
VRVIFISGPPRAGKDTAAGILQDLLGGPPLARVVHLASSLKDFTHRAYGISGPFDQFDERKDARHWKFNGASPRTAYINMWRYLSTVHGPEVLGLDLEMTVMDLDGASGTNVWIVPDLGRRDDALPVIRRLGVDRVFHVRMIRKGTTFEGDSRVDVDLSDLGVAVRTGYNSGTTEELRQTMKLILTDLGLP